MASFSCGPHSTQHKVCPTTNSIGLLPFLIPNLTRLGKEPSAVTAAMQTKHLTPSVSTVTNLPHLVCKNKDNLHISLQAQKWLSTFLYIFTAQENTSLLWIYPTILNLTSSSVYYINSWSCLQCTSTKFPPISKTTLNDHFVWNGCCHLSIFSSVSLI